MREVKSKKNNPFKNFFIKICRFFGLELIDQSNFSIPTSNKSMNDTLSVPGKKSITLPMGKINITRPVKSLNIILRTCMSVNMLTQSKKSHIAETETALPYKTIMKQNPEEWLEAALASAPSTYCLAQKNEIISGQTIHYFIIKDEKTRDFILNQLICQGRLPSTWELAFELKNQLCK